LLVVVISDLSLLKKLLAFGFLDAKIIKAASRMINTAMAKKPQNTVTSI
jgi:hypothetical protein